jgi:hypothetical protein
MLTYADVRQKRMLTYADVCWRKPEAARPRQADWVIESIISKN